MNPKLVLLTVFATGAACAQDPAAAPARSLDRSAIEGHAGAGFQGSAGVNVAAGTGNVQANVRAIALGPQGAAAVSARQTVVAGPGDAERDAHALLSGSAFDSAAGLIGLNQAAGGANAQLNVLAIGPRAAAALGQQLDNLALASIRVEPAATAESTPAAPAPVREARIDGAALGASSGILQLNQTAGAGNASANTIVLQLPGGTP